ncbi:MAG: ABC transporter permease subunit [Akkermansiaceae bacterium]|nr:ABC transporter permease subunit [Akkermansiaceae bacterium]NNM29403.1 ABC transporter permease subunit [Akkermansiaceae bacterium]
MRAVWTLLVDSYRLLRARILFWIALGISLLVGVVYLSIGFTETGVSFLFGAAEFEHDVLRQGTDEAEILYLGIFSRFIVGLWLSWVAIILALVSCASIYPDFMSEGSIELALSKPVRRLTLFFSKYLGSLLFMLLLSGSFVLLVFLALRWRIGTWNPSIFWYVPLTVLVFSYLYSVVVLVTVRTRSTLAGVLFAMLVWFMSFILDFADEMLYTFSYEGRPDEELYEDELKLKQQLQKWHRVNLVAFGVLPKTKQTMLFADRLVVVAGDRGFSERDFANLLMGGMLPEPVGDEVDRALRRNSVFYILGTSLGFEAVMLGLAALGFCRRDF